MKKIIKYIFYAALAIFFAAVLFRIFQLDSSNVLSDITPTDNAKAAYAANGEILTHDILQQLSDDGYSRAYSLVYLPDSGELQLTVKYNENIYKAASVQSADKLAFKLYDTETAGEYYPSYSENDSKGMYGYTRLVFENISFSENADLELVISSEDYSVDYSCFKLHKSIQTFEAYKLSKEERALLGD